MPAVMVRMKNQMPRLESVDLTRYVLIQEDCRKFTSEKAYINKSLCRDMAGTKSLPSDRIHT